MPFEAVVGGIERAIGSMGITSRRHEKGEYKEKGTSEKIRKNQRSHGSNKPNRYLYDLECEDQVIIVSEWTYQMKNWVDIVIIYDEERDGPLVDGLKKQIDREMGIMRFGLGKGDGRVDGW